MTELSTSILASDLSDIRSELGEVETADRIHVDVMDGHFVPNLSIGFPTVESIQHATQLPIDIHLMIENPSDHIDRFVALDIDSITIHIEATTEIEPIRRKAAANGITTGVAINPSTDLSRIKPYLNEVERLTVMGVEPGFAGQSFLPETINRIDRLDSMYSGVIEIDGGITVETARKSTRAGANIVVSGSTIFESQDRHNMIKTLRTAMH